MRRSPCCPAWCSSPRLPLCTDDSQSDSVGLDRELTSHVATWVSSGLRCLLAAVSPPNPVFSGNGGRYFYFFHISATIHPHASFNKLSLVIPCSFRCNTPPVCWGTSIPTVYFPLPTVHPHRRQGPGSAVLLQWTGHCFRVVFLVIVPYYPSRTP